MNSPLNFLVEPCGVVDRFPFTESPSVSSSDSHRESESEASCFSMHLVQASKSDGNNNNSCMLVGSGKLEFDHGLEPSLVNSLNRLTNDDVANLCWSSNGMVDEAAACLRNLALTGNWSVGEETSSVSTS